MEKTIKNIEQVDGIRLTWNIWPVNSTKTDLIPIACLYNVHQSCLTLPCEPIFCNGCKSTFSQQSKLEKINEKESIWTCMICNTRNKLIAQDRNLNSENALPERMDGNSTVEYILTKTTEHSPVFVLLIDTCTYDHERHEMIKKAVLQTIQNIPDNSMISIILFGYDFDLISFDDEPIKTIYRFSGKCAHTKELFETYNIGDIRSYLVNKSERLESILDVINNLEQDPFPAIHGTRKSRCTGAALSFAVSMLKDTYNDSPVKYMLFTQGPCTYGPGRVSLTQINNPTAERLDLDGASAFYKSLAESLNASGHSIDIIAETIADIGIEQMGSLIKLTGGCLIMAQDFDEEIQEKSLEKMFEKEENEDVLKMGFNVKIQVKTSHNLVVKGMLGEGRSYGTGWRVGAIYPRTNLTILFENTSTARPDEFGYVQIITQYQRSDKTVVSRVTSFCRMFTNERSKITMGFDQEAASVFQARAFLMKNFQNINDFENAIDKTVIRFIKKYGSFTRQGTSAVTLPDSMSYYPNFMFFFRRSLLVQKEGISQDESAYFKILLFKLMTEDAIKMIKPSLISFHYQGDIRPVELDTSSLNPECLLVLDSFHNVLLWKGRYVASWINEGLHETPEYAFFKQVIDEAKDYSLSLLNRIPMSQYKETDEGRSQERILLHFVNPSQQDVLNTEKIDYNKYFETICQAAVRID